MTKADDDAKKASEALLKKIKDEQHNLKVMKGTLQRDSVRLTASNKHLTGVNAALHEENEQLASDIATSRSVLVESQAKNSNLEVENHRLEVSIEASNAAVEQLKAELVSKKAAIDTELEAYALDRKQAIKADILAVNDQLTKARVDLAQVTENWQLKRDELTEINSIYMTEQTELKASSAETQRLITENQATIDQLQAEIDAKTKELQSLAYEKDNFTITLTKARAEHQSFIEYEKKARKILETKDRQLQERYNEIATESQFLKTKRSFLSEL